MEITLERKENGRWRKVPAQTIFAQGDYVRFRYRGSFAGNLYVMNQGSSGDYVRLFPGADTGQDNYVEANREYVIPAEATGGAFRISGPAGYDTVYWVVMPAESGATPQKPYKPLPPPPANPAAPKNMTPRCDETIWKARGECLDRAAGPRAVTAPESLPSNLGGIAGATPRELVFLQDKSNSTVVSAPAALNGPVVYEFRIAHK
jgi:hypothetical protein